MVHLIFSPNGYLFTLIDKFGEIILPRIQYFLSSYPTLLELAVEATYPICEALTVSLISVSASVQGVTIMELDHYLAKPIPMNVTSRHSVRLSLQSE